MLSLKPKLRLWIWSLGSFLVALHCHCDLQQCGCTTLSLHRSSWRGPDIFLFPTTLFFALFICRFSSPVWAVTASFFGCCFFVKRHRFTAILSNLKHSVESDACSNSLCRRIAEVIFSEMLGDARPNLGFANKMPSKGFRSVLHQQHMVLFFASFTAGQRKFYFYLSIWDAS